MREASAALRAVAAYGLPGVEADPPAPIEPEAWPLALAELQHQKLTGVAWAAAEAGWLPLKDDQLEDLLDAHRDIMVWSLGIERLLLDVADAFDSATIGFLVLKGPAVAHAVYPDPSWRPFGDLDLLVRTSDWRKAVEVLQRDFGPRRIPEPRPGFDERFSKGAVFTTAGDQQIDLHRTLASGPFGQWIVADVLFEPSARSVLAGRPIPRPDPAGLFVHACVHAVLGDERPRLHSLRDVAQSADTQVDWDAVRALAGSWRLRSVVQLALARTSSALGWSPDVETAAAAAGAPDRREERALRAYVGTGRSRGAMEIETIRSLPGVGRKVAYARSLLLPRREFLRSRLTDEQGTYLRRLATPVRWALHDARKAHR